MNELVGVIACGRVHGQAVDVPIFVGQNGGAAVDGHPHAVEHAAQHIFRNAHLQRVAQKTDFGFGEVDAGRVFKQLHNGRIAVHFQHLAAPDAAVAQLNLTQLVIGDPLHMVYHHQRAGNFVNGFIFANHSALSPFCATASSSCSISASISA